MTTVPPYQLRDNRPWPIDAPFHYSLDVAALSELLDSLGTAVHLVGHSHGSFLALTLVSHAPTSTISVIPASVHRE